MLVRTADARACIHAWYSASRRSSCCRAHRCGICDVVAEFRPQASASWCVVDGDEYAEIYDYRLRNHTLDTLRLVESMGGPCYVMAGFRRPHRNFKVFKKYYDLYNSEELGPVATHKVRDPSQPLIAMHSMKSFLALPASRETNGTTVQSTPDSALPDDIAALARRMYSVAVTQTDAYVGALLDELDTLGLAGNTVWWCTLTTAGSSASTGSGTNRPSTSLPPGSR